MRKLLFILPMILLLAACGTQETFETVDDSVEVPAVAAEQQLIMELPLDAQAPVSQGEDGAKMYVCDNCVITVQVTESGDVEQTIHTNTGFAMDQLQIVQTCEADVQRYECVWTAIGEGGEQVGRLCVLDDGAYHYTVTAMADAEYAGSLRQSWASMFDSMHLLPEDVDLNTGS